ncbi:hypothetical protein [Hymenobacter coalescens]
MKTPQCCTAEQKLFILNAGKYRLIYLGQKKNPLGFSARQNPLQVLQRAFTFEKPIA